jgi:hypothetical protein
MRLIQDQQGTPDSTAYIPDLNSQCNIVQHLNVLLVKR